jgi:hypothetical protein
MYTKMSRVLNRLPAIVALLALPAISRAAETCPWLNAATAGGALGSAVTLSIAHDNANRDDMACNFAGVSSLRIAVQTNETPRNQFTSHAAECGTDPAPLKAIGNEAVVCNAGKRSVQVVGRVRNRIFTILISTTDASLTQAVLREKARDVAEHVAGNLF